MSINNLKKKKIVKLICPTCKKSLDFDLPEHLIEGINRIITFQINKNQICEHSFQAFIDKDGFVRGYQKVDFELPNLDNLKVQKRFSDFLQGEKNKEIFRKEREVSEKNKRFFEKLKFSNFYHFTTMNHFC